METFAPILIDLGLPGAVIAWLVYQLGQKDKRIDGLTDRLIHKSAADAEKDTATTGLLERILASVERRV